jgi:hypothetical protein
MTAKETVSDLKECAIALKVRQDNTTFAAIALEVCVSKQKDSLLTEKECSITTEVCQQTGKVELNTTKV